MPNIKHILATSLLALSTSFANATVFNFISLTQGPGGLGESAWSTLGLTDGPLSISITGHANNDNDNAQYAYLDWGNAGLGVCKDASSVNTAFTGSGTNRCNPSSDDNVTVAEYLRFSFNKDVVINNFWFNNNHDGGFGAGDQVTIGGTDYNVSTGYAGGANGIGPFFVAANTYIDVAYKNEEFYISGMEVNVREVSEPATIALLGLSLIGVSAARRRK